MADKKLQILRVADVANNRTGGIARAMYTTGEYIQKQGHSVEFLFADGLPKSREQLRRFTTPLYLRRFVRDRTLAGKGWDVIEVHEPSGALVCQARKQDKRMPPVVAYSHGVEARGLEAMLSYHARVGLPVSVKQRYSPLSVIWQANYALEHAAHRLLTNEEDKAYVMRRWRVPKEAITIVKTGIIPSFIAAGNALQAQGWENARYNKVLFLASWVLRKGTRELVAAMNRLLQERPEATFTIAGCGIGEDVVRSGFAPGVQPRIAVTPEVRGDDALQALYASHGVFVLPSFFEGQPAVMIEAAALHAALVMTDICGMKDFMHHGKNGVAIPVGDADALYTAVNDLMVNPTQARTLGANAHQSATEHTWESGAQAMLAAYHAARGAA